jgi:hypothetical protein
MQSRFHESSGTRAVHRICDITRHQLEAVMGRWCTGPGIVCECGGVTPCPDPINTPVAELSFDPHSCIMVCIIRIPKLSVPHSERDVRQLYHVHAIIHHVAHDEGEHLEVIG